MALGPRLVHSPDVRAADLLGQRFVKPCANPIYLDHLASTPVDPRVADEMVRILRSVHGNPNSIEHSAGCRAQAIVDAAARHVGALFGAPAAAVVFTSGSTESLALALAHAWEHHNSSSPMRVVATPVEHSALLDPLASGQRAGRFRVTWLSVDELGRLDAAAVDRTIAEGADIVCVMAANNEIGNVYPIQEIGTLATRHGAKLLVDATQAAGRVPMEAESWGLTYVTASAHKMYGPKGVGALVVMAPEPPRRHGTPNVPGIGAFGEAARLRSVEMHEDEARIRLLRDALQQLLLERIPGLQINGDMQNRLACSLHVSVAGVPNDAVLARLHDSVAISSGAACSRGALSASHVLQAMRMSPDAQEGALRMAVGKFTTAEEVDHAAELIAEAIRSVRRTLGVAA